MIFIWTRKQKEDHAWRVDIQDAKRVRESSMEDREEKRMEQQKSDVIEGAEALFELDPNAQSSEEDTGMEIDSDFVAIMPRLQHGSKNQNQPDPKFVSLNLPKKIMQCDEVTIMIDLDYQTMQLQ